MNGFYSFEVLREVVECFGDQLLNLNELVEKPLVLFDFSSPKNFVSAALAKTSFPCTLIVYWKERLHYTSIHIESTSSMWHLDSKQRKPRKLTMRMVQDIMMEKSCYTFVLVRKLMSHLAITSSSNEGMLPTGASIQHNFLLLLFNTCT